jgi:hypothetical protein
MLYTPFFAVLMRGECVSTVRSNVDQYYAQSIYARFCQRESER